MAKIAWKQNVELEVECAELGRRKLAFKAGQETEVQIRGKVPGTQNDNILIGKPGMEDLPGVVGGVNPALYECLVVGRGDTLVGHQG